MSNGRFNRILQENVRRFRMEEKLRRYFGDSWYEALGDYLKSPEFLSIGRKVTEATKTTTVYPESELVFRCFRETPYDKVTTILCAQDPYFIKDVADGLAFSCSRSLHPQPSLKNMLIEIEHEYPENKYDIHDWRLDSIDLIKWAKQGVLLLNLALTMIKFENTEVMGWEAAIRGMRNPMNSWENSDSGICFDTVACHTCRADRNHCKSRMENKEFCKKQQVKHNNRCNEMTELCPLFFTEGCEYSNKPYINANGKYILIEMKE